MLRSDLDKILLNVQSPAKYIGGELNSIIKPDSSFRMALSYPDMYEVGMSNNGIRILYDISNKLHDVACERVFAVDLDFEKELRNANLPLYTLETFTPLHKLDILGFNVSHELLYSNILQILDLGKIPIKSIDRDDNHPIIVAGGDGASNPFPISEFIDAFFLGDGEDGIIDIIKTIQEIKKTSSDRKKILNELSKVEGVLIPTQYKLEYNDSILKKIEGKVVTKRKFLEKHLVDPIIPIVPNIRITQERITVEITKGCKNFCKFCHAGYYHLPYRAYNHNDIIKRVLEISDNTGYNEVTLSSLSISDYKNLNKLLNIIIPILNEKGISISLPSLRVDKNAINIIQNISGLRKSSLTFAVESASQELLSISNKKVIIDDLIFIVDNVFKNGWKKIKLYFMIGLPGYENIDEAEEIIALLKKINNLSSKNKNINVTISPFIPKPHTPFEREKQAGFEYLLDTVIKIKRGLPRSIKIKNHNIESSILEGIFSRGDTRLSEVIYQSYIDGARHDSWKEHFKYPIWEKNLASTFKDQSLFLQKKEENQPLSWDLIDTGFEDIIKIKKDFKLDHSKLPENNIIRDELQSENFKDSISFFENRYNTVKRGRIKFTKIESARYIPHIDFIEIIKRALRMSNVPVSYSQGFNKREKLSMGFPTPLGINSISDFADIELYDNINIDLIEELNKHLPVGIEAIDFRYIEEKESLMAITNLIEYKISINDKNLFKKTTEELKKEDKTFIKKSKKKERTVSFNEAVYKYSFTKSNINIILFTGIPGSIRIDNLLLSLCETNLRELYKFNIAKIDQYRKVENDFKIIY
jgi:radical SAM family uncharacterized protein/radical SAM-linked protein